MVKNKKGVSAVTWILAMVVMAIGFYMIARYITSPTQSSIAPIVGNLADSACKANVGTMFTTEDVLKKTDMDNDGRPNTCDLCTCSCEPLRLYEEALKKAGDDPQKAPKKMDAKFWDSYKGQLCNGADQYDTYAECLERHNSDDDKDGVPAGCDLNPTEKKTGQQGWTIPCQPQVDHLVKKKQKPRCNLVDSKQILGKTVVAPTVPGTVIK